MKKIKPSDARKSFRGRRRTLKTCARARNYRVFVLSVGRMEAICFFSSFVAFNGRKSVTATFSRARARVLSGLIRNRGTWPPPVRIFSSSFYRCPRSSSALSTDFIDIVLFF